MGLRLRPHLSRLPHLCPLLHGGPRLHDCLVDHPRFMDGLRHWLHHCLLLHDSPGRHRLLRLDLGTLLHDGLLLHLNLVHHDRLCVPDRLRYINRDRVSVLHLLDHFGAGACLLHGSHDSLRSLLNLGHIARPRHRLVRVLGVHVAHGVTVLVADRGFDHLWAGTYTTSTAGLADSA